VAAMRLASRSPSRSTAVTNSSTRLVPVTTRTVRRRPRACLRTGACPSRPAQTSEAVDIYNRLAVNEPVGALFHVTC
jgi:hypothetical protein